MRENLVKERLNLRINRRAPSGLHSIGEVFSGPSVHAAVRKAFGDSVKAEEMLKNLRVEVLGGSSGYMWIEDSDGHLAVADSYLRSADERSIYLDLVHEFVHLRQLREGRDLYDSRYSYVDRPTELEAYAYTVEEARRLGMTDSEIKEFLRVEWIFAEDHEKLTEKLGLTKPRTPR